MANKVLYNLKKFNKLGKDESFGTEIGWAIGESSDNIAITNQVLNVKPATNYVDYQMYLQPNALFTWFILKDLSRSTNLLLRINDYEEDLKLQPELWIEEAITKLELRNLDNLERDIQIIQAFPQKD